MVRDVVFDQEIIDVSKHPKMSCTFRVGANGVQYVEPKWNGGLFNAHPDYYILSVQKMAQDGVITTSLELKKTVYDQNILGSYYCVFSIISKLEVTGVPLLSAY
ncbi:unnamed protein product [Protopolystoma xenopodis]|uniref:Uncharacterized protein n=1 Tax=Protopolystoma xenopodis TaxID=117903 RepID=A0A448X6K7_9PLAT|nr:unnamed protein product [Protopolystoma xenopodis]